MSIPHASRELDALVAEKIFQKDVQQVVAIPTDPFNGSVFTADREWLVAGEYYTADGATFLGIPNYSTDIAAAWQVVEHFRKLWTAATENVDGLSDFEHPFRDDVFFGRLHRSADRRWPWAFLYITPEAICRAALAAVGVEP